MSSSVANYTEKRIRQVITPEGLSLPFTVASRGARIGALLLDLFFVQFASSRSSCCCYGHSPACSISRVISTIQRARSSSLSFSGF